jgi:hypothetical protein
MGKNVLRHFPPTVSGEGGYERSEAVRLRAEQAFRRCKTRGVICKAKVRFTTIHSIVFQGIVVGNPSLYKRNPFAARKTRTLFDGEISKVSD